jgi:predicted  nucleic acid-binding Zn-ribbon protein
MSSDVEYNTLYTIIEQQKDKIDMMSAQLTIRYDKIKKLKSEAEINNAEWERICNAYANENQRLSDYIEELKQQKHFLADKLYLATRRTDDNGDLIE